MDTILKQKEVQSNRGVRIKN